MQAYVKNNVYMYYEVIYVLLQPVLRVWTEAVISFRVWYPELTLNTVKDESQLHNQAST
jgi:hypothetical protein